MFSFDGSCPIKLLRACSDVLSCVQMDPDCAWIQLSLTTVHIWHSNVSKMGLKWNINLIEWFKLRNVSYGISIQLTCETSWLDVRNAKGTKCIRNCWATKPIIMFMICMSIAVTAWNIWMCGVEIKRYEAKIGKDCPRTTPQYRCYRFEPDVSQTK